MEKLKYNFAALETMVLKDEELLCINGGTSAVNCGAGCGVGCGGGCGEGCMGCNKKSTTTTQTETLRQI